MEPKLPEEDIIFANGIQLHTRIGIKRWEHERPQPVIVDVWIATRTKLAAQTDTISDTLDYDKIVEEVHRVAASKYFNLVETLAEEISTTLLQSYPIRRIRIRINKPTAVLGTSGVGVDIIRTNQ